MTNKPSGFGTRCVHGAEPADSYGAPHTPLYDSTTFRFASTDAMQQVVEGRRAGCLYTRYGDNPSVTSVEAKLAGLESAGAALVFGSGMAAISATLLGHGGRGVVCLGEVYGGTWELMTAQLPHLGIPVRAVSARDMSLLEAALAAGAGLVYFETPANPTLEIIDIARVCELAKRHGARVAVDSTFATPVNQLPLVLGADLVIHSATKYLGGHSDLIGGVVAGTAELLAPLRPWRKNLGQILAPAAAHLLARSLATLEVRVERQNASALTIARALQRKPGIARVRYPGLEDFPGHAVAARQMRGFGGMLTLEIEGTAQAAARIVDRLRVFSIAASLGGVESLVSLPALTSHRDLSPAERAARGIGDNLVRLSIGLESPGDLLEDLEQAIAQR